MSHRPYLAVALFLGLAVSAVATPTTDPFANLLTEMRTRQAALLAGTPEKPAKAEAKALGKSIDKLSKPTTELSVELGKAVTVIRGLEKTFPADFQVKASPTFGSLVTPILNGFDALVESEYSLLVSDLVNVTTQSLFSQADGDRQKARMDLDAFATTPSLIGQATLLGKALGKIEKGRAVAAKQKVGDVMTASIDGAPFAARTFDVTVVASAGVVDATGYVNVPGTPSFARVQFIVSNGGPITGTGPFSINGVYDIGTTPSTYTHYTSFDGTLTFSTFDLSGKHLVGDFSFTANGGTPTKQVQVLGAHFDIRHFHVQ